MRGVAIGLLTCLCAASGAAQTTTRSTEASIGLWPFLVGNIDSYTNEIINKAKSTGLDTLYVSAYRASGQKTGTLYIADEAKTWSTANGALVPRVTLGSFTRKAHAAGLQVVAVLKVFDEKALPSDYGHQDYLIQKVIRYLVHSYDSSGQRVYPLDGLAFDYVRFFGGSHTSKEVNRFLDEARKEVGSMPLHAYLIAGAYALDGSTYDNKFRTYSGLMSYVTKAYGQHWSEMAKRLDVLMPMTYTANGHVYGKNLAYMEGYVRQASAYARQAVVNAKSACRVVPATQTWSTSSVTTTQATVEACCKGAMSGGADGFMAFRYFSARGNNSWFSGLAKYSEPGLDLPIAALTMQTSGLQAIADTTKSFHSKVAQSLLRVRLDLDGDGSFDYGPAVPGKHLVTVPPTGRGLVTVEVTDPKGHRAFATVRFATPITLTPTAATVSANYGGNIAMQLTPGLSQKGQNYIVFASLAGTSPGTPLGGSVVVPLNADALTPIVYGSVNTPMFQRFAGPLDANGVARPAFNVPAKAIPWYFVGTKIYFAAVGVDRTTAWPIFASNAVTVTVLK